MMSHVIIAKNWRNFLKLVKSPLLHYNVIGFDSKHILVVVSRIDLKYHPGPLYVSVYWIICCTQV